MELVDAASLDCTTIWTNALVVRLSEAIDNWMTQIASMDYPNLNASGERIETIAAEAVPASYIGRLTAATTIGELDSRWRFKVYRLNWIFREMLRKMPIAGPIQRAGVVIQAQQDNHRPVLWAKHTRAVAPAKQNRQATVRGKQNVQASVRSAQDARAQDRSKKNDHAPSFQENPGSPN